MRGKSQRAKDVAEAAEPVRKGLRDRAKVCEVCLRSWSDRFLGEKDVHEILRGPLREKTLAEPCSLIVCCRRCHEDRVEGRFDDASERSAYQLAFILRSRPDDYDLARFNFLRNENAPRFVEQHQVERHLDRL